MLQSSATETHGGTTGDQVAMSDAGSMAGRSPWRTHVRVELRMLLNGDNDKGGAFPSRLVEELPRRLGGDGRHHQRQRLLNKLLGVAHVVYEQNLVAVTAASAPPILEPSRVSSCVCTGTAHPKTRRWCRCERTKRLGRERGRGTFLCCVLREGCRAEIGRRLAGPALRRRCSRAPRRPSPSSAAAALLSGSRRRSRRSAAVVDL